MKVLILGVNGFIGSTLSEKILEETEWDIYGMDLAQDKLEECIDHDRFHFFKGDMLKEKAWIMEHIKKCDVVLPLAAIANPAIYVSDPLRVFELDFEANLEIVRLCVKYKTRLVFPSTSEVYGMCEDEEFDEETSNFVLGPVNKPRWIYSCSKQMMDRVITAYGDKDGLQYTLFRPFNWVGPKLDQISEEPNKSARVLSQFISNILYQGELNLVDGGKQKRAFVDIEDGLDALMLILKNEGGCADGQIFNIGYPENEYSIKELSDILLKVFKEYPDYADKAENVKITNIDGTKHYGKGYQDVGRRVPSIKRARDVLGWKPETSLEESIRKTLDYHLG